MAEIFCKRLWNDIEKVWSCEVKPMMTTEDDKIDFDNATQCWICQKDFTGKDKQVRDHCHVMALGHYMREKSTESKGDSLAESTQTAETIESGSAGTAGKTRKGGQKQGKKPKGESRNK